MPKTGKAQKKVTVKKTAGKSSARAASLPQSPRRVKLPKYRPISLKRRIKPVRPALPGSYRLLWRAVDVLKKHWQVFLGIIVIYGILNVVFVRGLAGTTDLTSLKAVLSAVTKGPSAKLSIGFTLFLSLLAGSNSSTNPSAGVYQTLLLVVVSLAVIWTLRQLYNNEQVHVRDGFYRGMYPFVQFILVLMVVGLQLIPLLVGALLYSIVVTNGIAVNAWQTIVVGGIFFILAVVSLYMLCSSLFALYVVTLPNMTPLKALRSARQLVRYRRFIIMRKVFFLPIALLTLAGVIIIPISLTLTPAAQWIFFALSLLGLPIVHSYMYALYRELLNE